MKYDIYFHDDFDGRASAAVMLDFLNSRGDEIEHFTHIDFDIQDQYFKDNFFSSHKFFKGKRNPPIVVDFPYHPKTAFWFDHHTTAFKREDWKKQFHSSKNYRWDEHYPSCCHFIVNSLLKDFGYKPSKIILELAKWLDVIDAARYSSAKQTILNKEPALKVNLFIEDGMKGITEKDFIKLLASKSLIEISKNKLVEKVVKKNKIETKNGLKFYKKNIKIYGSLGMIFLKKGKYTSLRFAPFYFYPNLRYFLRIVEDKNKTFGIGLGVNPWNKNKNKIHIGEFLKENFLGAGGHHEAGGAGFKTKKDLELAIKKIIENFS